MAEYKCCEDLEADVLKLSAAIQQIGNAINGGKELLSTYNTAWMEEIKTITIELGSDAQDDPCKEIEKHCGSCRSLMSAIDKKFGNGRTNRVGNALASCCSFSDIPNLGALAQNMCDGNRFRVPPGGSTGCRDLIELGGLNGTQTPFATCSVPDLNPDDYIDIGDPMKDISLTACEEITDASGRSFLNSNMREDFVRTNGGTIYTWPSGQMAEIVAGMTEFIRSRGIEYLAHIKTVNDRLSGFGSVDAVGDISKEACIARMAQMMCSSYGGIGGAFPTTAEHAIGTRKAQVCAQAARNARLSIGSGAGGDCIARNGTGVDPKQCCNQIRNKLICKNAFTSHLCICDDNGNFLAPAARRNCEDAMQNGIPSDKDISGVFDPQCSDLHCENGVVFTRGMALKMPNETYTQAVERAVAKLKSGSPGCSQSSMCVLSIDPSNRAFPDEPYVEKSHPVPSPNFTTQKWPGNMEPDEKGQFPYGKGPVGITDKTGCAGQYTRPELSEADERDLAAAETTKNQLDRYNEKTSLDNQRQNGVDQEPFDFRDQETRDQAEVDHNNGQPNPNYDPLNVDVEPMGSRNTYEDADAFQRQQNADANQFPMGKKPLNGNLLPMAKNGGTIGVQMPDSTRKYDFNFNQIADPATLLKAKQAIDLMQESFDKQFIEMPLSQEGRNLFTTKKKLILDSNNFDNNTGWDYSAVDHYPGEIFVVNDQRKFSPTETIPVVKNFNDHTNDNIVFDRGLLDDKSVLVQDANGSVLNDSYPMTNSGNQNNNFAANHPLNDRRLYGVFDKNGVLHLNGSLSDMLMNTHKTLHTNDGFTPRYYEENALIDKDWYDMANNGLKERAKKFWRDKQLEARTKTLVPANINGTVDKMIENAKNPFDISISGDDLSILSTMDAQNSHEMGEFTKQKMDQEQVIIDDILGNVDPIDPDNPPICFEFRYKYCTANSTPSAQSTPERAGQATINKQGVLGASRAAKFHAHFQRVLEDLVSTPGPFALHNDKPGALGKKGYSLSNGTFIEVFSGGQGCINSAFSNLVTTCYQQSGGQNNPNNPAFKTIDHLYPGAPAGRPGVPAPWYFRGDPCNNNDNVAELEQTDPCMGVNDAPNGTVHNERIRCMNAMMAYMKKLTVKLEQYFNDNAGNAGGFKNAVKQWEKSSIEAIKFSNQVVDKIKNNENITDSGDYQTLFEKYQAILGAHAAIQDTLNF